MGEQTLFCNLIENIFLRVGTVLESTNAQVVDIQRLTRRGGARPRNPMITRALRLFEEFGDLNFVSSLQQVGATKKTRFLTARQERHNSNLFTEANGFAFVIIDSSFDESHYIFLLSILVFSEHLFPLLGSDASFDELALISGEHRKCVLDEHTALPEECPLLKLQMGERNLHPVNFLGEG